jgi:hypothetical protein
VTPQIAQTPKRRGTAVAYALTAVVVFGLAGGGAIYLTSNHAGSGSAGSTGAGAAGSTANPANSSAAFLASVQRTESLSFTAEVTMRQSFTESGPGGSGVGTLGGSGLSFAMHLDQENPQRIELREHITATGLDQTAIAVLYDGTCYLSTDNGAIYQTVPISQAASHELSPKSPLQFFEMVGTVKEIGGAEVNSAPVTEYHADLDPAKVSAYFKNQLAAQNNPFLSKLINSIGVTGGSLDVFLDSSGRIVSEAGSVDAAIDLGVLSPSDAGSTLNTHISFTGAFSDFGSPITVARPAGVTGATTLT